MKKISITISQKLLNEINQNIEGKNRSDKIRKCVSLGYELLKEGKK